LRSVGDADLMRCGHDEMIGFVDPAVMPFPGPIQLHDCGRTERENNKPQLIASLLQRYKTFSAVISGILTRMPSNLDAPLKTYLDHLARGELAYQFSPEAGRAVFYPRTLCPFTGSDRLEWRISKGLGTVYATTVVHPIEGKPFNVALIDCDEGFRLMSRVEDIAPEQVRIGQRVHFRVHQPGGEEPPQPVFVPVEGA
jgi:uncharacterized OB-fold protein